MLEHFTTEQCAVIEELVFLSEKVVVMSERAELPRWQGAPWRKIDSSFTTGMFDPGADREIAKRTLGLSELTIDSTFGLMPDKGIEIAPGPCQL